ncbi:DNA adenine methylase [Candidatus Sulfidibacterium hydrothermale]|uniref:DNA adenine methylase n=1 Tax=Candidatus Sulfidibacterium hydrothermale TaxID=2875962 RepID=UPI001F0AB86C|nr:DNA adenine methylase [Candidatus Sulfidibacterium hydrothermale]UBM61330.1 DNA adenine methylase [Candidatus Sulfidibacterium hydrothermale]
MGINLTNNFYSPLRYPGGKGKLSHYIQLLIEYNLLIDGHYVEPYAGGASVALSLLFNEYVRTIHINDFDYRIYCFWHSVLFDTENLCDKISKTSIDIKNWLIQKEIQKNPKNYNQLEIGFSTFFLNRTNRSGILKAGVIGGKSQNGKWKLDARFNKEELIKRIRRISRYKNRIKLYNKDALELTIQLSKTLPSKTLFYFDPPYYKKGKDLYINFYEHADHLQISKLIKKLTNKYWLVSYDNNVNIREFYKPFLQRTYELNYHAGIAKKGTEILIFSDNLIVPELLNPTDKNEIRRIEEKGLSSNWIESRNTVPNTAYKSLGSK